MIATVASQQIRSLKRQRVVWILIGTLLVMTLLAGVIGWSSHRTIIGVYDEAVKILTSKGRPAPANPFLVKPSLSLLSNMVIYITLIGALLALLLGHLTIADDQSGGVGRLIFTRAVTRTSYAIGKVVSVCVVLAAALVGCWAVSVMSLWVVNGGPASGRELERVAVFYAVSWLYLLIFSLVGMITVLATRRRSIGLLSAMGVWLVVTFVVPQFTSGLRPTASLNPIIDPVSTSQTFFRVTSRARPVSIVEQYKQVSGRVLETASAETTRQTIERLAPLATLVIVLVVLLIVMVRRHDFSGTADDE